MLWGLDRATFRKASTATGARVIRSGGIMSVGIDTNADGKIDTVLGMAPRRPKLLARLISPHLLGTLKFYLYWLVERVEFLDLVCLGGGFQVSFKIGF